MLWLFLSALAALYLTLVSGWLTDWLTATLEFWHKEWILRLETFETFDYMTDLMTGPMTNPIIDLLTNSTTDFGTNPWPTPVVPTPHPRHNGPLDRHQIDRMTDPMIDDIMTGTMIDTRTDPNCDVRALGPGSFALLFGLRIIWIVESNSKDDSPLMACHATVQCAG